MNCMGWVFPIIDSVLPKSMMTQTLPGWRQEQQAAQQEVWWSPQPSFTHMSYKHCWIITCYLASLIACVSTAILEFGCEVWSCGIIKSCCSEDPAAFIFSIEEQFRGIWILRHSTGNPLHVQNFRFSLW